MEYKGNGKIKLNLEKEYGIVLEGGGARGAYQIGVWKALREADVMIKGVSGTSVGALNGAMICMDDFEVAEEIWSNLTYSQVMDVNEDWIDSIISGDFLKNDFSGAIKTAIKHLKDGGFDTAPLRKLIEEKLSPQRIKSSEIDFFFEVFSLEKMQELSIDAKQIADEDMTDMLLASAYLPVFKKDGDLGRKLMDGGMINNVPIDALLERGYEDIICIRIYGIGVEKRIEIPDNVNVYEIAPRINLGGILEFDKKRSRQNMKAGYYDGLRFLYGLEGKIYYIDMDEELGDYECMCELAKLPYEARTIMEKRLPQTATELKLGRDWDYKELYLAMIEATAKFLKVSKYCVYTFTELKAQITEKWQEIADASEEIPDFISDTIFLCRL